jgi:hypothetical protein
MKPENLFDEKITSQKKLLERKVIIRQRHVPNLRAKLQLLILPM